MKYEYASINANELSELNTLQERLSKGGKKVVLLAVEQQYAPAKLSENALKKINALEKELSADGKETVLVAFSK